MIVKLRFHFLNFFLNSFIVFPHESFKNKKSVPTAINMYPRSILLRADLSEAYRHVSQNQSKVNTISNLE